MEPSDTEMHITAPLLGIRRSGSRTGLYRSSCRAYLVGQVLCALANALVCKSDAHTHVHEVYPLMHTVLIVSTTESLNTHMCTWWYMIPMTRQIGRAS